MGFMRKSFVTLVVLGIFAVIAIPVANAGNGDPALAGSINNATGTTEIRTTSGSGQASAGTDGDLVLGSFISNGSCTPGTTNCTNFVTGVTSHGGGLTFRADGGTGLNGVSLSGALGVSGHSQAVGGTGVRGVGAAYGVEGQGGSFGLYGHDSSVGVYAQGTSEGVHGFSGSGTGVAALSTSGTALSVTGKATFSRSGKTAIAAGLARKDVPMSGLTPATLVTATVQGAPITGLYVASVSVQPTLNKFRIHLSKAVPAGKTATVGWFVVN